MIDDLFALQTLLDRHQVIPVPSLPQLVEQAEQRVMEEINYVVWLITIGSQVYIAYSLIIVYLGVPLSLSHSRFGVRLQRKFFATSQLTCKLFFMQP